MIPIFQPLCTHPRAVILDTDIGPDCDDVGALVCLIHYAKTYSFPIVGICNCTSNRSGNGAVDAVCRHCGLETPPLGQWEGTGFLDEPYCHKYNDTLAEAFSDAFRNGSLAVSDAVTLYRARLAEAPDDGVMLITIGMFNNLAALLDSHADDISPLSGLALVRSKVHCLVSMAAIYPEGREYNVYCAPEAAQTVFSRWPTPIYLSDFRIGYGMMTGYGHLHELANIQASPAAMAYHLYASGGVNHSFDLTAVQFAVFGEGDLYGLHDPAELEFYEESSGYLDATRAVHTQNGRFRFLKKRATDTVIAESLNRFLKQY